MVIARLLDRLRTAAAKGWGLVFFPKLALSIVFPCWVYEDEANLDNCCETEMSLRVIHTGALSVVLGVLLLGDITADVPELEGTSR